MNAETVSVVIPVFNGAVLLPELVQRLERVLSSRCAAFEIIPVNDGSQDRSWEVIAELARQHPCVRGIDLARNYGQHNALLCGIRAARHEIVVTLDDDLQHAPEDIPALLDRLAQGRDVVYGTPIREQHGWWRDGSSMLTKMVLQHLLGAQAARQVSAFRAFRASLRDAFADFRGPSVMLDALLTWGTTRFDSVPVRHAPRRHGQSNYSVGKLVLHALNLLTGFSTAPLHFASLAGMAATLFGVIVFVVVLARYLIEGSTVPGFPFLASIIAILSGTQLLTLGIMGEYLARTYCRMMDRPVYTIRSSVESN